jgi:hypothetical protein
MPHQPRICARRRAPKLLREGKGEPLRFEQGRLPGENRRTRIAVP